MENKKISLKDGFFKQNIVFMSGLLIAPVIACATTLQKSLAVCIVFTLVSFMTILLCRAIPRKIAYTLRVIVYSLVASAFYIPAVILATLVSGNDVIVSAGVYLPILVTNNLILSKSESRFYVEPLKDMVPDVLCFIAGFDIACIFTGAVREILAKGTIGGAYLDMPFTVPALETTFGGFLFVGIMAGLVRGVYNYRKEKALRAETSEDYELAEYAEDMGEFLVGKKNSEPDKIRIYKPSKKKEKADSPEDILDMDFSDNRSLVEEFAAIVAGGAELVPDENKDSEDNENWSVDESSEENSPENEETEEDKEETEE